jgi:hypothetical protein
MTPGRFNFVCPQGATFKPALIYKVDNSPVNLTGYTARMQVRESHTSDEIIISLSTNSGITIDGPNGQIEILISASETSTFTDGDHVYDLEIISAGGEVYRLLQGRFNVTPEVTR